MGILLETEIRSISKVQGLKNFGEKSDMVEGESLKVRQWRQVYIQRIQRLLSKKGHQTPAKYSRATRRKQSSREHELDTYRACRSIRLQVDMSEGFRAEAVNHASYVVNMSLSTIIDLQIPKEIW